MTRMNPIGLLLVVLGGLGMTVAISLSQVRAASEEASGPKSGVPKSSASPAPEPPTAQNESSEAARARLNSSPAVKKIVSALLEDTRFEFIETPFPQFVAKIQERHGIAIQIDEPQLRDIGIDIRTDDLPITRVLKGVTLHSALQLILTDLGITYVIRDGTLVITTREESRRLAQQGGIHAEDVKRELEKSPAFRRKNAKIVKSLQGSTQIEFNAAYLTSVVDFITKRHGIPIEFDTRELDNLGVETLAPCTLSVKGVKLATALDKLVGDLGLTYVVEGEYILITAAKKAVPKENNGEAKPATDPVPAEPRPREDGASHAPEREPRTEQEKAAIASLQR